MNYIHKILSRLHLALILPAIALAFLTWSLPATTTAEVIDRVVAEVNDDVITLSEVEDEGQTLFKKIAREVAPSEQDEAFSQARQDILRSLIDKKLINQEAAKENVSVSEDEIDAAFQRVLTLNKLDRETFLKQLKENGLDEATYRSNLKSQVLQNKLITREISSKIVITDEMMLDYYDKTYTQHVSEGGYYLLQIGIGWGEQDGTNETGLPSEEEKAAARQQVERVHKLALAGNDFSDLARKFSDLPSAAEGGDIGVFEEDEMASYMKDAIVNLKAGEISDIIETPVGFQFFKLLSSKEGGIVMQAPFDSVKDEIREKLFREAMQKEYEDWISGIRERAFIRVL